MADDRPAADPPGRDGERGLIVTSPRGRVWSCTVAAAVLAAATGCGEPVQYGRVAGVVTIQGEPVSGARVLFLPSESKGKDVPNPSAFGVTGEKGEYVLQTPADGKDGVRVGTYRVVIDNPGHNAGARKLPARYADMLKTPLPVASVKEGEQTFDFELTSDAESSSKKR